MEEILSDVPVTSKQDEQDVCAEQEGQVDVNQLLLEHTESGLPDGTGLHVESPAHHAQLDSFKHEEQDV